MADRVAVQTALTAFSSQASAELEKAKADQAAAAAGLEAATVRVAQAEADLLLGKGVTDVMNGAAAVANAVSKAEAAPTGTKLKWLAIVGGGLIVLAIAVFVLTHLH
jgi:hypothetical protein